MIRAFESKNVPTEKIIFFPNVWLYLTLSTSPTGAFRKRHQIAPEISVATYQEISGRTGIGYLFDVAKIGRSADQNRHIGDGARPNCMGAAGGRKKTEKSLVQDDTGSGEMQ